MSLRPSLRDEIIDAVLQRLKELKEAGELERGERKQVILTLANWCEVSERTVENHWEKIHPELDIRSLIG